MGENRRDPGRSKALHDRATEVFPGGVSHNIRYFPPHPLYVREARDSRLWDEDGNEYLDFWMNHHASLLGHVHPDVVEAVVEQVQNGLHYGTVNEKALRLGEKIQQYVPSAERLRFCASGTEATMYATRLARAFTGRNGVMKARGGWHGGNPDLTYAIHAPFGEPETRGLPPGLDEHCRAFTANDEEETLSLLDRYGRDTAALIVEPVLVAGGCVPVREDFLRMLRRQCDERGTMLIFDEVITGFRVSPGSYQDRVGVTPDLTTLGKIVGGGLPVGAVAGSAEVFEAARPDREVPPEKRVLAGGGTYSMNPMTATAGLATLEVLETEPVHSYTEQQGDRVRREFDNILRDLGIPGTVNGVSSLFMPHFGDEGPLTTVEQVAARTHRDKLLEYQRRMLERGFYFLRGSAGNISYQTTPEQLDAMLETSRSVLEEMEF